MRSLNALGYGSVKRCFKTLFFLEMQSFTTVLHNTSVFVSFKLSYLIAW